VTVGGMEVVDGSTKGGHVESPSDRGKTRYVGGRELGITNRSQSNKLNAIVMRAPSDGARHATEVAWQ
jgi:hypothetical protein